MQRFRKSNTLKATAATCHDHAGVDKQLVMERTVCKVFKVTSALPKNNMQLFQTHFRPDQTIHNSKQAANTSQGLGQSQ